MHDGLRRTFVLVHGASGGGWWWEKVAKLLRARGHKVWTPTLPAFAGVTPSDYVEHVAALFGREGLNDVVLVGHSLGGMTITGVADRLPDRLRRLIYLDALIPRSGQSVVDLGHWLPVTFVKALSLASSGGRTMPPPPARFLGARLPHHREILRRNAMRQPMSSLTVPVELNHEPANGVAAVYITCTRPKYRASASSCRLARECGWPVIELSASHAAPITEPVMVTELLVAWA